MNLYALGVVLVYPLYAQDLLLSSSQYLYPVEVKTSFDDFEHGFYGFEPFFYQSSDESSQESIEAFEHLFTVMSESFNRRWKYDGEVLDYFRNPETSQDLSEMGEQIRNSMPELSGEITEFDQKRYFDENFQRAFLSTYTRLRENEMNFSSGTQQDRCRYTASVVSRNIKSSRYSELLKNLKEKIIEKARLEKIELEKFFIHQAALAKYSPPKDKRKLIKLSEQLNELKEELLKAKGCGKLKSQGFSPFFWHPDFINRRVEQERGLGVFLQNDYLPPPEVNSEDRRESGRDPIFRNSEGLFQSTLKLIFFRKKLKEKYPKLNHRNSLIPIIKFNGSMNVYRKGQKAAYDGNHSYARAYIFMMVLIQVANVNVDLLVQEGMGSIEEILFELIRKEVNDGKTSTLVIEPLEEIDFRSKLLTVIDKFLNKNKSELEKLGKRPLPTDFKLYQLYTSFVSDYLEKDSGSLVKFKDITYKRKKRPFLLARENRLNLSRLNPSVEAAVNSDLENQVISLQTETLKSFIPKSNYAKLYCIGIKRSCPGRPDLELPASASEVEEKEESKDPGIISRRKLYGSRWKWPSFDFVFDIHWFERKPKCAKF